MPMTVREYAETRGYSRVAIYKAIDRSPELENCIYQGVSNGKSAKFINDEGINFLDQTLKPSSQSNIALKNHLELVVANREKALADEHLEKVESLLRETAAEKDETRKMMLARVDAGIDAGIKEIKKIQAEKIERLEKENAELRERVKELEIQLQHPLINIFKKRG